MRAKIIVGALGLALGCVLLGVRARRSPAPTPQPQSAPAQTQSQAAAPPEHRSTETVREATADPAHLVPETIGPILGLNHEALGARWAAVRALGTALSRTEIEALYAYLQGHEADPPGSMRGVIKNDVILALKNQNVPPEDLAPVLLGIFHDRDQDPVIRNYALQHLVTWYDRSPEQNRIRDALWAGANETDASLVGTALIGLCRLEQAGAPVERQRLEATATALATQPGRGDPARMTALQVCADLGVKTVLPTALELARVGPSVPLRVSALNAVGALGETEQANFLKLMLKDDDTRVQTAARAALRRLETLKNG